MDAAPASGANDEGSSPVEFVLVGAILTALTLAVLQLGIAMYVRNIVHDAAVTGAFHAALADVQPGEGAARTEAIITQTLGGDIVDEVSVSESTLAGEPAVTVTVAARVPLAGLLGVPRGWEVSASAPREELD